MKHLKIGNKYELKWIDAIGYHGWYEIDSIEELIEGYMVTTLGYFVKQTKLFIVLAQSYQTQNQQYGNIKYIPIGTITKIRDLK